MKIDVLTLFPGMFDAVTDESILKRGQKKGLIHINIHNLRDWTRDRHRTADDRPFGGGPGMVMKVEPVYNALKEIVQGYRVQRPGSRKRKKIKIILLTPQGRKLNQGIIKELAGEKRLVLICGHYEGVDERIRSLADDEISIGDYILTCGELPAMVLVDSIARLVPGVLGHKDSVVSESFENDLLEYPQYTRPAEFEGMKVPEILLSGNHNDIAAWRREEAVKRTGRRRPDLLKRLH